MVSAKIGDQFHLSRIVMKKKKRIPECKVSYWLTTIDRSEDTLKRARLINLHQNSASSSGGLTYDWANGDIALNTCHVVDEADSRKMFIKLQRVTSLKIN